MWGGIGIYLCTHHCRITPSLTLSQLLTRTVPLKASSILVTLLIIKPVYIKYNQALLPNIQPLPAFHKNTDILDPLYSTFSWPGPTPQAPADSSTTKRWRAKSQDHFEVSLFFCSSGMGRESPPPSQQRKTTWGQLLGMLLTQDNTTDRGKDALTSSLYPSNGINSILQPVTAGAAQAYIPARVSKAILKEPYTGIHPNGNAALDRAGLHLSCELGDEHETDLCCPTVCPVTYPAGENSTQPSFLMNLDFHKENQMKNMWQKKETQRK